MLKTRKINNIELEQLTNEFEVLGYSKIESFIDSETCNLLRKKVEKSFKQSQKNLQPGYSDKRPNDKQVFNLQNKDKIFIDLLSTSSIEKILVRLLNDEHYKSISSKKPNYIIGELIARSSGDKLKYHMDSWLPSSGRRTWMLQLAIALDNRGINEGCTIVVPGSHRSDTYTDRNFTNGHSIPMKKGDLVIWDSRLWHGALPRKTKSHAWAVIATMQMWWVKQRFDLPRGLPYDMYRLLSDKQKALIGFASLPPRDELFHTDTRQGYKRIKQNMEMISKKMDEY